MAFESVQPGSTTFNITAPPIEAVNFDGRIRGQREEELNILMPVLMPQQYSLDLLDLSYKLDFNMQVIK